MLAIHDEVNAMLWVANVGDSRGVMRSSGPEEVLPLSYDHKPNQVSQWANQRPLVGETPFSHDSSKQLPHLTTLEEGLLELLTWASSSPLKLLSELHRYKHTVRCLALVSKVTAHRKGHS